MSHGAPSLLDAPRYVEYLKRTHPGLDIDERGLSVPTFKAPLDIREPLLPGFWRGLLSAASTVASPLVMPPSLFIGTPFERYDQTHLLDVIDDLSTLTTRARAVAQEESLDTVVITNLDPKHPRLLTLIDSGFVPLPSFPDTVVRLEARTFEDHLALLPPGDRSGIRRNVRRFEHAGHRLERLSSTREHADALYSCYLPFFERARVRWQPHTRAYFEGLAELDPRVHVFAARNPADEIIGFVVSFEDGENVQAARLGVRPDYHRKDAVYFRLLYHVLEDALVRGGDELSLEPTGYRMKRHLGAFRRPLVNLVLGVSPAWRALLAGFVGLGHALLAHLEEPDTLERYY